MRHLALTLAGAGLLLAAPVAFAQHDSSQSAQPASYSTAQQATETLHNGHPDPNEIICKKSEPDLGSRIPAPPQCHTRQQWSIIQEDSQNELNRIQTTGRPPGQGGG